MLSPLLVLLVVPGANDATPTSDRLADAPTIAAKVDALVEKHWRANKVPPARLADDSAFLRRLTLDLAGRIPTHAEAVAFARDRSADKRARAVRRLMGSPEYPLHLGRVLDDMIQEKLAGDAEFLAYLRASVAEHKNWDQIFREVMLGPWDAKERKGADRFLVRRLRNLDDLTNDTARVFFGVNVSCAKCHDHPLVADWTQDHYYGMVSFFNRTAAGGKGGKKKKGGGVVTERPNGEVMFVTTTGQRRTAKMMFLSRRVIEEPPAKGPKSNKGKGTDTAAAVFSRREQLVKAALEEKKFFSRAIANRLWAYFMGRGLVHPLDQMHSANPPSVPGLLEWLSEDLAAHRYDLDRLVAGLVSSRVYQRSSAREDGGKPTSEKDFAQGQLRPLTPQQYAMSLILATGDEQSFDQAKTGAERSRRYRELEGRAGRLTSLKVLDARSDQYQASTGEALFMSNHADVQRLLEASGKNLVSRLARTADTRKLVETAVWTVLSRAPEAEEQKVLAEWVEKRGKDRAKACGQLIWALMTSAEFRFNH
jgi:Protein of unknown function (DUF1549)/Protein of unknown function (DUF1553)